MSYAFSPSLGVPLVRRGGLPSRRAVTPICSVAPSRADDAAATATTLETRAGGGPAVAFGGLAPAARKAVVVAAALLAGAVSGKVVPGRDVIKAGAAGVVGVSVGVGVAGLGRGKVSAARKALGKAVRDGGVRTFVEGMGKRYGLEKREVGEVVQGLFELSVEQAAQRSDFRFEDVGILLRLKENLGMDGGQVGDACYEAVRAFYRGNVVVLDSEEEGEGAQRDAAQVAMDRLFFTCERLYRDNDTDEAAAYEISRVCNFFAVERKEFDDRVERIALPFYRGVVMRAVRDASIVRVDVQIAQEAIGVSDTAAATVRGDAYADVVADLVEKKGKLEKSDIDELARLRDLFVIAEDRATVTLKTLADPIYRSEVNKALDAAAEKTDSMATIYGRLTVRESELGMPSDAAKETFASQSGSRAVELAKKASKYLRVQNLASCISAVKEMLSYGNNLAELVAIGEEDPTLKADAAGLLKVYASGVSGALSKTEPRSMYRLYLSDVLKRGNVTPVEEEQLSRLRAMLGLTDLDAAEAFKAAAGPVYRKAAVSAMMKGEFDAASRVEKDQIIAKLALPVETVKSINLDLYKDQLEKRTEGNRIIQEAESQALFSIRQFFDLSQEDVAGAHKYSFGPVYEQSVSEAMGATGIMLDEYREGLEKLRMRLTLSQEDADDAYYRVVKMRMSSYVNRAMAQLEKSQNLRGGAEERDMGDDPNIRRAGATLGIEAGGLPTELSNLVDFYVRNKLVKEEEVPLTAEESVAAAVQAASAGEEETEKAIAEGGVPKTKTVTTYPVTLKGIVEPKVYNELYRQYVIQCFGAQTRGEKQRLFASLDQLGPILGMSEEEVSAVHSGIGTVIYQNYAKQTLLKGPIAESDMEFLNNIQKMLSMKDETCKQVLKDAKETRVSVLCERIFSAAKVLPESVKNMRGIASQLGVDIVKDLKISIPQRKRLFGVEVDEAIDTGAVTGDNQDLIKEVQAELQVPDEEAKEVLLTCIQRRTLSHLVQASASLRSNRSEVAVAELRTMLRYGKLLPSKVVAPSVSSTEKQEMFMLFQADTITDGTVSEEAAESLKLLQILLGFSDAELEASAM